MSRILQMWEGMTGTMLSCALALAIAAALAAEDREGIEAVVW